MNLGLQQKWWIDGCIHVIWWVYPSTCLPIWEQRISFSLFGRFSFVKIRNFPPWEFSSFFMLTLPIFDILLLLTHFFVCWLYFSILLQPIFLLGGLEQGAGRISCCECLKSPSHTSPVTFDLESLPGELAITDVPTPIPITTAQNRDRPKAKPLTERYLVKRVNSASVVEVKVGLVRGNCSSSSASAGDWRSRSVSVSVSQPKPLSRVRLISTDDLRGSLHRLQSHHSSSGEEWFEEDDDEEEASKESNNKVPDPSPKTPRAPSPGILPQRDPPPMAAESKGTKKRKCCNIL